MSKIQQPVHKKNLEVDLWPHIIRWASILRGYEVLSDDMFMLDTSSRYIYLYIIIYIYIIIFILLLLNVFISYYIY